MSIGIVERGNTLPRLGLLSPLHTTRLPGVGRLRPPRLRLNDIPNLACTKSLDTRNLGIVLQV